MPLGRTCCVAVGATAALLLSGCGNLSAGEVERAANAFATAQDPASRCDLLTTNTLAALVEEESSPCEEAIGSVPIGSGGVVSVEVWGEEAQAELDDDTLFLTRTSDGWRVMAAACTSQGANKPYDCQLEAS